MKLQKLLIAYFTGITFYAHAFSAITDIKFSDPIPAFIHLHTKESQNLSKEKKQIYLMHPDLSAEQKSNFLVKPHEASNQTSIATNKNRLPKKVEMGMNGVPVLDQGLHGSCETFAITAALDAILGQGDYISQLCHLSLGSYLSDQGYFKSGWDGTMGYVVLNQIQHFGIVNKSHEKSLRCGGLARYPANDAENTGQAMNLMDFTEISEPPAGYSMFWEPVLSVQNRLGYNPNYKYIGTKLLQQVKKALATKTVPGEYNFRLTMTTFLPLMHCDVGACANRFVDNDSWVLSQDIINDQDPELGAHALVITGYDDNAVAIDSLGQKHTGLLHLRSSWGPCAGHNGDYYMSYDFFKVFVLEVQKIVVPI